MKRRLILLSLLGLSTGCAGLLASDSADAQQCASNIVAAAAPVAHAAVRLEQPRVLAIKMHADWCGSCKRLHAPFADLQNKFDGKRVMFATLDVTNRTTTRQAAFLAAQLGLQQFWKQPAPDTGYILLVDARTKRELGRITKNQCLKQMSRAMHDALRQAYSPGA